MLRWRRRRSSANYTCIHATDTAAAGCWVGMPYVVSRPPATLPPPRWAREPPVRGDTHAPLEGRPALDRNLAPNREVWAHQHSKKHLKAGPDRTQACI
jgi:hypothetical protein